MRLAASRSAGPNRCALFGSAGLLDVQVTALEVPTVFADLDALWQPFVGGQGPAPGYFSALAEALRCPPWPGPFAGSFRTGHWGALHNIEWERPHHTLVRGPAPVWENCRP